MHKKPKKKSKILVRKKKNQCKKKIKNGIFALKKIFKITSEFLKKFPYFQRNIKEERERQKSKKECHHDTKNGFRKRVKKPKLTCPWP